MSIGKTLYIAISMFLNVAIFDTSLNEMS